MKNKILIDKPYKPVYESSIVTEIEKNKLFENMPKGNFYVTMTKFNNSGLSLFDLNSPFIDAISALRLFRFLKTKYLSYEIQIHKRFICKPVAFN